MYEWSTFSESLPAFSSKFLLGPLVLSSSCRSNKLLHVEWLYTTQNLLSSSSIVQNLKAFHWNKIMVLAGVGSSLEPLWRIHFPALSSSWRPPTPLISCPLPPPSKPTTALRSFSSCHCSLTSLLDLTRPCDYAGLTQIIQDGPPQQGLLSSNLNSTCNSNSLLPCNLIQSEVLGTIT